MHFTLLFSILACCTSINATPISSTPFGGLSSLDKKSIDSHSISGKRTVGYYGNWDIYARNFKITDIDASQFTHILYSFANVNSSTGEVHLSDTWADLQYPYPGDVPSTNTTNLYGNLKQLYRLKRQNRTLKTMLAIGGATYSQNFVSVLASHSLHKKFASTAVHHMYNLGFDGLSVDYEYVTSTEQASQLVSLLCTLREEMDHYARKVGQAPFLMSFATSAGPEKYKLLDIPGMDKSLDFWDFMGFDYTGAWDTISGHSANLFPDPNNKASTPFNTTTAIQYYIENGGVCPSKMNLGSPLYGHGFANTARPGTSFNGTGGGSWGAANGVWDYKALPLTNTSIVTELPAVGASYSYDSETRYMVSYDVPRIARQKAEWVVKMGLGGCMWWEISMDKVGDDSLVGATLEVLGPLDSSQNHLNYPLSEYANLRAGM